MRQLIGAAIFAFTLASPLAAQEWFLHQFGELRAYHGDWLAVCTEEGAGPCRMVQTGKDAGSDAFFDNRIALHRIDGTPDWSVVIMDRGMDAVAVTRVWAEIDGETLELTGWSVGEMGIPNVAETVTVTDPALTTPLVAAMQAGNRMVLRYTPQGGGDGMSRYSLRGVTAAANAINARVLARQE